MDNPEADTRNSPIPLAPIIMAPGDIPDIYIDGAQVNAAYTGISLLLQRFGVPDSEPQVVGIVRMSPQQAFLLAQILRRIMAAYQQQFGAINLPDAVFDSLGLSREL